MDGYNINRYDKAMGSYMNSQLNGSVIAARKSMQKNSVVNEYKGNASSNDGNTHAEGEIIKGEVLDLKNKEITVMTDKGEVINAKVKDASSLYIGQKVEFKTSNIGGKLYLEPIMNNSEQASVNTIINRALEAAGLSNNEKNVAVAKALLNNNMSVDKQSIMKIIAQTYTNQDASIDTIVLMNKHHIPIENDNAAQFENYRNYEHRMIKELGDIATSVPEIFDKITSGYELMDVNHEVIDILSTGPQPLKSPVPLASTAYTSAIDKENLISVLSNFDIDPEVMEGIKVGWARLDEVAFAIKDAYEQAKEMDIQRAEYIDEFDPGRGIVSAKDMFENPVVTTVLEKNATFVRNSSALSTFLSKDQINNIYSTLKDIEVLGAKSLAGEVLEGKISAFEFIQKLDYVLETADVQTALKTLKLPEYKDIIREAIISKWTITADNVADPKEVENTYERIYEQTEKLSNLVSKSFGEFETQVNKHSNNVKNNINFMDTLNDMFSYVQLPIKLANHNIHSELFVMTDKKKLAANKDNINVLLRLEMEHLGLIDVRINKTSNIINANFQLPNKIDVDLFKANMGHLEYTLLEKGFILNGTAEHKVEEMDIVKDFIERDSSDMLMKRYTFDIRA